MLGFLLARAGIDVVVLEKHGDFLRDFRGDTIHPSTLELMHELGLYDEFLRLPHAKASLLRARLGDRMVTMADFRRLPTRAKFVAFLPQWDFLDFLAARARALPAFELRLATEATELLRDGERIAGVVARDADGAIAIHADLTIACDGRSSRLRDLAGMTVQRLGAPMDVLWFRLAKPASDHGETMGTFDRGQILIQIDRGTHWQCASVIAKGGAAALQAQGIESFRAGIAALAPALADRVHELTDWTMVKLLSVAVDRLSCWHRDGFLCLGDAAHAMSPIGGVGVNLAIQDAVAAANLLHEPLRRGRVPVAELARVQARRLWPTRVTQRLQLFVQDRVIARVLAGAAVRPPFVVKLLQWLPFLQRLPARLIGLGLRPEHIRSPECGASTDSR